MRPKSYLIYAAAALAASVWLFAFGAHAQQAAKVLSACNTATYVAGTTNYVTLDTTGGTCGPNGGAPVSGTVTANQGAAGASAWLVQGAQAHGAAPSGNPNQVGLYYGIDGFIYRMQSAFNGMNLAGTGLLASALSAQCDNVSPAAITENQWGAARMNCADHNLLIHDGGNAFSNITTATDTVINAAASVFLGISVNTGGAGSSVAVYNNTTCTGTKIGTFSTATQGVIGVPATSATVGLCVTTSGGTPADITVYWRNAS